MSILHLIPTQGGTMLAQAHDTFRKWLGDGYDLDALDIVLSCAAVEQLDGDPVWLLMISGSGNAKTETVGALSGADATVTSTISSEGALLSATARKDVQIGASGGLLRQIGPRGLLVIKDFTSILSMNRDMRSSVLAALREVYDGSWVRAVGTDGGRTLTWDGRLVVIGASTTAYDAAHSVIASMGDRFALVRVDSGKGRLEAGRQALMNVGHEAAMRVELAAAVGGVLDNVVVERAEIAQDIQHTLLQAADLVCHARTAVEMDFRGDPLFAHQPEMPTRFGKMLGQVVRGGLAIGMDKDRALAAALRVARDSIPPDRLALLEYVRANRYATGHAVATGVHRPGTSTDRALQQLEAIGLLRKLQAPGSWQWYVTDLVDPSAYDLIAFPRKVSKGV